ncbi:MAG: hypothetical protein UW46_C0001G0073 [Candidatus Yanofskybacteria bacterium GW2011_GWF1_44_227]|uniref:Uncharacterized protein n=1 Tax=Candidatus Yanofskybacteria bacterium GW2011_GWE2_40_11 TaxID=1619033 RepID=A0A0G0QL28_9BACT|nr:MAG: hypothetical protein UT69_C0013G0003 [Candidatus Yanofskybacteria bacterium GW2011_GWE1_40_10]KKR41099.1 MAG: hypothetical protein UT75_C0001G0003 [Candidatus Yanofskybacteria bacterium GW2011_GWE2_40_11]KKT15903.1 MAG: hypothetical protein UV97_C0001G0076 [Candidatus Yanofskybacteria bacterium GW2011_GWF2_43_596]KKT53583.1 MAG: hypothetical protein UW46_C0001G0073 [Candidatus Yanofskybacteria bacterium GW2011_GWF1_44_227]OGN36289.1 MAG: hypothetical protein A2241_00925 [Candidatus Yano
MSTEDPTKIEVSGDKSSAVERSAEEIRMEALLAKRDVLSANYALTKFSRSINERIEDMSDEEVKTEGGRKEMLKNEWKRRMEKLAALDPEAKIAGEFKSLMAIELEIANLSPIPIPRPPEAAPSAPHEPMAEPTPAAPSPAEVAPIVPSAEVGEEMPAGMAEISESRVDDEVSGLLTEIANKQRELDYTKSTARPLALALAESEMADLQNQLKAAKERQANKEKLEEEERKAAEKELKLGKLKDRLSEVMAEIERVKQDGSDPRSAILNEIDEIRKRIEFAKSTGRVPGIGPDGLALAEEDMKNARARLKELEDRIGILIGPMEDEADQIRGEIRKLEGGVGKKMAEAVETAYESAKGLISKFSASGIGSKLKKAGGWLWERAKGMATVGGLEYYHAEKFRRHTFGAADTATAFATQVEVDTAFPYPRRDMIADTDKAQEYANKLVEESAATGEDIKVIDGRLSDANRDYWASIYREAIRSGADFEEVEKARRKENDGYIERTIGYTMERILEGLKKYKNQFGENVLTPEKLAQVEDEVRKTLVSIREAGAGSSFEEVKKRMRDTLDSKWWSRYVYGAIETLLWIGGIGYIALSSEVGPLPPLPKGPGLPMPDKLPVRTPPEFVDMWTRMTDNIWNTIEINSKVPLTDSQLVDASKQVLNFNQMYEPEWTSKILDSVSSRSLPQGQMLRIPFEVLRMMGL